MNPTWYDATGFAVGDGGDSPATEAVLAHGKTDRFLFTTGSSVLGPRPLDLTNVLEAGYGPYPFGTLQPVIEIPAISPTAAVAKTPWEKSFGEPGQTLNGAATEQALPVTGLPTVGG